MALTKDWLLEVPRVSRSYSRCVKETGTSQRELRKLAKSAPKKASRLKRKVLACLIKKHRFLLSPRQWEHVSRLPRGRRT